MKAGQGKRGSDSSNLMYQSMSLIEVNYQNTSKVQEQLSEQLWDVNP